MIVRLAQIGEGRHLGITILNVGSADGQVGHHGVLVGGDPLHLVLLGSGVEPGVDIVHEKF